MAHWIPMLRQLSVLSVDGFPFVNLVTLLWNYTFLFPLSERDLFPISRNSQALLDCKNQVYCGKCGRNTSQRSSCSFENSIVLIEIVRVLTFRGEKSRNNSSVYFPLTGISLPGRSGTFSVVATCNHRGSFDTGHWFSQIQLSDGAWFKIDNLEGRHIPLPTIGKDNVGSSSVVLLMLLHNSARSHH